MKRCYSRAECTERMAMVAMGRAPADAVIQNVKLVNVLTAEIQDGVDIAITMGRIALVGDAGRSIGPKTIVTDGRGRYAAPGFIDGHIHIESSMMLPGEYARAVVPHGTTTIFPDPHEIGNVFGTDGVRLMIEDSQNTPLRCRFVMPSCVPAVADFEDSGATITPDEVAQFMAMPEIAGLGEMMNYPGVVMGDKDVHAKIKSTLDAGKVVTGHYPVGDDGSGAMGAYIAAGCRCCHETTKAEDALSKLRLGMYVQVREGSAWQDLTEVIRVVTENNIDTRYVCLVSDDAHPHTLIEKGHMDHIIRRAIEEGVEPVQAIQMATLNAAQCYGLEGEIGAIAPGWAADIVLMDDIADVSVDEVWIGGILVAKDKKPLFAPRKAHVPAWARASMKLKRPLDMNDFRIEAPVGAGDEVNVRLIEIIEAKAGTHAREATMPIADSELKQDIARDIIKVAALERHHATGRIGLGFVSGFGLRHGAVASTVAHDAHNLQIVGTNDADMALAGNVLAEIGGGMVAVKDGEVLAKLALPIGGLMSGDGAAEIAAQVAELDAAWKALGCEIVSPFMTMALLPLAVIPELRITNRGLIDAVAFAPVSLFV